jgi:predicted Holliday junction resolvase-like endonuclease
MTSLEEFLATDALGLGTGIVIGLLVAGLYLMIWKVRYTAAIREDAVSRSRAVTAGKIQEQLIQYLPGFPYNPKDVRFLGSPIDLVVFDGLAEGEVRRVIFVEVKTGRSALTRGERSVRAAIEAGAFEWAELRVSQPFATGAA